VNYLSKIDYLGQNFTRIGWKFDGHDIMLWFKAARKTNPDLKPPGKPALIGELFIQDRLSWTKFHLDWLETWRP
jgi:hypothetical protein